MPRTSATSSSSGRDTSRPRVDGTMQYEQTMLQPAEVCTQPWNGRSRLAGRWPVKPSNSKKPWAVMLSLVRNSASLCTCPGPNATSTNGNISNTWSFRDCDQQPPIPITRSGSSVFSRLASPRWPTRRLSAFSRIEQVLKRIRSAPARSPASLYPSDSSMPFMRSESCSFIWHPKVVRWYVFTAPRIDLGRGRQQTVDQLQRRPALEHRRDVVPVQDQREARRDHEVRGVELRPVQHSLRDPGVV